MGEEEPRNEKLRTVIEPTTIKAFLAGLVIGNVNKQLLLGFAVGAVGGVFIQQNVAGVPDVAESWKDFIHRWNKTRGGSSSQK